jgi:hypothetical protein
MGVNVSEEAVASLVGVLYPEDGGNSFFCSIGFHLPNYTTSHPKD